MTFDRVLPELIRACLADSTFHSIARYCVVRDVRGRVRLVVEEGSPKPNLDALRKTLESILGAYFVGPILSTTESGETKRLSNKILELAKGKWPAGWPRDIQNALGLPTPLDVQNVWTGIDRTIGKEAWLTVSPPKAAWPLVGNNPPIVTFHSFKGGVGRTTMVAAYAMFLASRKAPLRIALVDLDLEAPGLGALFDVSTRRGVIDILVDHIATGKVNLDDASSNAVVDPTVDSRITVFPAGVVHDTYIQKLARLDFSSTEPGGDNPVSVALTDMLKAMKQRFDVVVLDSRAGLHDLAGLSLHGLAHVDVLVFRGTTQNMNGLAQTLRTLGSRETALVLVETLLPSNDHELLKLRKERTREQVYAMMCEHIYEETEPPQLGDIGEPHDVVSVRRVEWLDGIDSLKGRVSAVLNDPALKEVARRIDEACGLAPGTSDQKGDEDDQ